jgi:hypothetical protein
MSGSKQAKEFSDGNVAAGGGEIETSKEEPVIKITQEEVVLCVFGWFKEAAINTDWLCRCGALEDDQRSFSSGEPGRSRCAI